MRQHKNLAGLVAFRMTDECVFASSGGRRPEHDIANLIGHWLLCWRFAYQNRRSSTPTLSVFCQTSQNRRSTLKAVPSLSASRSRRHHISSAQSRVFGRASRRKCPGPDRPAAHSRCGFQRKALVVGGLSVGANAEIDGYRKGRLAFDHVSPC
jgi:hypothetical protein